jgi:hypothetical protein
MSARPEPAHGLVRTVSTTDVSVAKRSWSGRQPPISVAERLPNALVGSGGGGCEQVDSVVGPVGNEYSTDQTGQAVAI